MVILNILLQIVLIIIDAFELVLLVYCISSWFIRDPFNKFMTFLKAIVDPVLDPIRALLSMIPGINSLPIDFSVLVAYFLCRILSSIFIGGIF